MGIYLARDGDKYSGEYKCNEETGKVTGCPARASVIETFVKAVRTKSGAKGAAATRNHAEAMKIEELKKLMEWSAQQCGPEMLETGFEVTDLNTLKLIEKHGMMRAFMSTGFTLWTRYVTTLASKRKRKLINSPSRNFETCGLQARDVIRDCVGQPPHYFPHFKVHLENRKGWQSKQGYDAPLESKKCIYTAKVQRAKLLFAGNTYEIYPQLDTPEADMNHHLLKWMSFLEERLGRALEPEDYLFPYIGPNGVPHPRREMTHDMIQGFLNEFVAGAKLSKFYTTHCFRRGGAQHRFMYAPLGKRWSLSIIRWWGGWAIGEHVSTTIIINKFKFDSQV